MKIVARISPFRAIFALCVGASLVFAAGASAHAVISPPVAKAKTLQLFTLSVPTEKENLTTTKIELTVPDGFTIDSFEPAPGWQRTLAQTGSGENAVIQKVTWAGGKTPTMEDSVFAFNGDATVAKTFQFTVRQTYSDGSVVDWSGPESSDTPAQFLEARTSFGGGGSSKTLPIIALIAGGLGLLAGLIALGGGRKRPVA